LEHEGIHGLTAAYALDALDERDELAYEEHLRSCERCRDELAALTEAASSLAYAVETPAPPAALRGRILEQARAERSNVIPLRTRRWAAPATTAVAAVAAVVAVAVGVWAVSLRSDLDETQEALDRERDVAAVVSSGDARSLELSGAEGRLVVARDGEAALLVSGLGEAPDARQYEMWVIDGGRPRSAGTFEVDDGRAAVRLGREVSRGSTFAVTLEPEEGGSPGPDGDVLFSVTV
jgi:anti-sigma-K factor RskA